jgi:beta-N-acetylhexosaminidase
LSKTWITDILRNRIGYRNLVVSDDLEMGGVLSAAPVGKAAIEFVNAGGDLCLVCHREDRVMEAYEALIGASESDGNFRKKVAAATRRVQAFKRKWARILNSRKAPPAGTCETLARELWEFSEQVRLEALNREEGAQRPNKQKRKR